MNNWSLVDDGRYFHPPRTTHHSSLITIKTESLLVEKYFSLSGDARNKVLSRVSINALLGRDNRTIDRPKWVFLNL